MSLIWYMQKANREKTIEILNETLNLEPSGREDFLNKPEIIAKIREEENHCSLSKKKPKNLCRFRRTI